MKINYLVLYAKLLLINMNHVDFFYRKFINTKNLTKLFTFVVNFCVYCFIYLFFWRSATFTIFFTTNFRY